MQVHLEGLADAEYAYVTTRGRVTGRPHEIEIWFAVADGRAWLISGGMERADWVRNLQAHPQVSVRIDDTTFTGTAAVVRDAAASAAARRAMAAKYQGWSAGQPLSEWAAEGLAVAITPLP